MPRYFATITMDQLSAQISAICDEDDSDYSVLIDYLGKDLQGQVRLREFRDSAGSFGPKGLMGLNTLSSGLTFCGMCAGGDWEHPVFFIAYWDGKKVRVTSPNGNPWNSTTTEAYGNDEDRDLEGRQGNAGPGGLQGPRIRRERRFRF
jgi:hypothetical protein